MKVKIFLFNTMQLRSTIQDISIFFYQLLSNKQILASSLFSTVERVTKKGDIQSELQIQWAPNKHLLNAQNQAKPHKKVCKVLNDLFSLY